MKEKYIELMAKALEAYSDDHIRSYFDRVRKDGLWEHGFPRLTANMGILISHGIRTDLLPLFCEMMDFCCENIPKVLAANDFSVKEIVFCLMSLEEYKTVPEEKQLYWRGLLATICPQTCYNSYAKTPEDIAYNWACFTLVSEYMRQYIGLCDSAEFVDIQIPTQLHWFEENGMYRDPNEPMVYDLVPRGLLAVLCHFGYRGRYYGEIDALLKKSGIHTLKMQSVTGEIPYGGRSNQFLFNEALLAIVCEYEANRWAGEGEWKMAAEYKAAVKRALEYMASWLQEKPIHHVKNRFPLETQYGCEQYAYFDKYMITAASFLYAAYLICDDTVEPAETRDRSPMVWKTSAHFHKVFMRSGPYFLEWDTNADPHYDCSGLGRLHREGAPSALCLSTPCTAKPEYEIGREDNIPLSLCPGILRDGRWCFAADSRVTHGMLESVCTDDTAAVRMLCRFPEEQTVEVQYTAGEDGVDITVTGEGEIAYMLPAFCFDGEEYPTITCDGYTLEITYKGWVCRYTTDGTIVDTGEISCNRNGHYRVFTAAGKECLRVHVVMEEKP